MDNSTLLLIHNIGYIFSAVSVVFFIILIYVKGRSAFNNQMLILAMIGVLIFLVSHVIGVNITDPHISRAVLMSNTFILFISCFVAHFVFISIGKEKEQKPALIIFYVVSTILFVVYMIFPNTFLLDSVPKLYFPNYYVAGNLQWVMRVWSNIFIPLYFTIVTILTYRTADILLKNRIKYLLAGVDLGYLFGFMAVPLVFTSRPVVFGLFIDPVYSIIFVPIFIIASIYAILRYDLFGIRIIAKKAFVYALLVAIVGTFVGLFNFLNEMIYQNYPYFPQWILPAVSSIIAVSVGFFIWGKLREADALRSEFITVVTHKFRTPLTQIRWATESLSSSLAGNSSDKDNIREVERASVRLVDLTNLLVQLSNTDNIEYTYHVRPMRVDALLDDMKFEYERRANLKGLSIIFSGSSHRNVLADEVQIRFVIQTLLDNAISYTPKGGKVVVTIQDDERGRNSTSFVFSVTDNGIGLSKEENGRMFEKFWRSAEARKADTEGMGIGLFMSRRIIEKQNGTLSAQSVGLGKGTIFSMKLPYAPF